MKLAVVCLLVFTSCTTLQNNSFVYGQPFTATDSVDVYSLPFEKGACFLVVQGYRSMLSHKGDYAIDFRMKRGTPIHAARGGVVVFARDTFRAGGIGKKFVGTGNGITIRHSDGSFAHYWHLQHGGVLVSVGETVTRGQKIGLSGDTGFSAFPHLHFEVTFTNRISRGDFPVYFKTARGVKFLQPLRCYKAI